MVQGSVWKYWSQISASTVTQREENVRPVCASRALAGTPLVNKLPVLGSAEQELSDGFGPTGQAAAVVVSICKMPIVQHSGKIFFPYICRILYCSMLLPNVMAALKRCLLLIVQQFIYARREANCQRYLKIA